MFQEPAFITMAIAATRMHRSLVNYTSRPKDVCDPPPIPDAKYSNAARRPSNPMEVAVHVVSEQHWISSQTTDDELGISTDAQVGEKQSSLCRDDDLERGIYK
jgi:hypothetical protein